MPSTPDRIDGYPKARGARQAGGERGRYEGDRLVESHEGKPALTVRAKVRVGEFGEAAGGTESGGG